MRHYRLYSLKNGNQIPGPPKILLCASDEEAIALASTFLDRFDIEIWQGPRVLTRLQPSDKGDRIGPPEAGQRCVPVGQRGPQRTWR
jgi:hypothetical protein